MWDIGKKIDKLWEQLPPWVKGQQTVRTTIYSNSDVGPWEPWVEYPIDRANLITSKVPAATDYGISYHRPVLDLDMEAALVPSSTPGHSHLYINHQLSWSDYRRLLTVLADVGILQRGFVDAAIERGATSARLPWIKKDDWAANQGDPDLALKRLQEQVTFHEAEAQRLRLELDRLDLF